MSRPVEVTSFNVGGSRRKKNGWQHVVTLNYVFICVPGMTSIILAPHWLTHTTALVVPKRG